GRDTVDDLAGRYVLLRQAQELASQAGEVAIALQAIDELAQSFQLPARDAFQARIKALDGAAAAVAEPRAYQDVVDSCLGLLDDALASDEYEAAHALLSTAERAARKLKVVSLVASVRRRNDEVSKVQIAYARWKPFADTLRSNAADPRANLEMGKYHAFIKGD